MRKRGNFLKKLWSILLSCTLILSCLPQMSFVAFAEEVTKTVVSSEAEFMSALENSSADVIEIEGSITLSRSDDGNDNVFVIDRPVTIQGGELLLERAGIILGDAVVFQNMKINFANPVRNAIIANGYALTLNNVVTGGNKYDAYNIDFFCGGIADYTGNNTEEIPQTGTSASITIRGNNDFTADNASVTGGNIYAGNLSDLGSGEPDKSNTYNGSAMITIEKDAAGVGEIFGHGARENREGGHANEWNASAGLYKVNGTVTISLKECTPLTIHGETGGAENASFIYTDDGTGYLCTPTLENISSIALYPSSEGTKAKLEPTVIHTGDYTLKTISVPANTRLSFVKMEETISVSNLYGGGELVFKAGNQTLAVSGEISGMSKIAVGNIHADGVSSTGNVSVGHTYITVSELNEDYGFELLPNSNNANVIIENDGNGNWVTKVVESDFVIHSITDLSDVEIAEGEMDGVILPIAVVFGESEAEYLFLGDIPMFVSINGKEAFKSYGVLGYDYAAGEADEDLYMWFQPSDTSDIYNEELYITRVNSDVGFAAGKYEISIVIPARYMEGENPAPHSFEFTLTVVCEEHTGGTATCKEKAVCEICGEVYGEVDSDNHTGGTELRGVREATTTETGYTGDTYCLGCNTKILDGEEIPKLPLEEPKISIESAVITLSNDSYVYDGSKKEPVVTVILGGEILKKDDYTIVYENNQNAGTASVIITGIGKYEGTKTNYFKIHTGGTATCKHQAVCEICGDAYGEVDSDNHTGGTELRDVKEATTTETGYTGDIYCLGCGVKLASGETIPMIVPEPKPEPEPEETIISIEKATITLEKTNVYYDGKVKTPKVMVILDGKTLSEKTDYMLEYKNNKNIGTATVIVTGKGNYTGTIKKTFSIKVQKGKIFTSGKYKYKVTGSSTLAFNGIAKTSTTKVTIPKSVTYGGKLFTVTSIAKNALKNKSNVTQLTINTNIKTIGASAFYGCSKLKTIIIHTEKLAKIGSNAFKRIHAKAVIKVPTKKYSAYQKLIKGKGQGSKVSIVIQAKKGDTFTSGNNNYKITTSSTIEFTGVKNVKKTEVSIPKSVSYGGKTFKVTAIATEALKGNTKVKKVTVGENVKAIGASAFYGCKNLKTISIKSTKLESVGKNALKGISSKATIYVPKSKLSVYRKLLKNKGQGSKVKITKMKK